MATAVTSVKFWINAFIPRDIPGYTITVPAGPHQGKTMIPGPGATNIRPTIRGVPYSDIDFMRGMMGQPYRSSDVELFRADGVGVSDCYLTDQRSFSTDIHAKSRMHSEFRLDYSGSSVSMTQWHNCDRTTEVDCEDGCVECDKKGASNRMEFILKSFTADAEVDMDCAANNPCSPSSRLFGDIDYEGTIRYNPASRLLEIDAKIDQFPAFEAYATLNDGAGVPIFQIAPPLGNTVMNLPGGANRKVHYTIQDKDRDGVFETVTKL